MSRHRLSLALVSLSLLSAVGCYESREAPAGGYRDSGPAQGSDGGPPEGDAATPADAATAADAATPADAAIPAEGGALTDGAAPACGDTIQPYTGSGCAEETRRCLQDCGGDPSCSDGCIADDFECALCVDTTLARCANAAGCQTAWDRFACCAREEAECVSRTGLPLLGCAEGCEGELVAYDQCVSAVAEPCVRAIVVTCGLPP